MLKINTKFFAILLLTIFVCPNLFAKSDKDVALLLKTKGRVQLRKFGLRNWAQAMRGSRINSGEIIRTGDQSLAALIFTDDKTLLKIRSNSNVTIKGTRKKNSIIKTLALNFGQLWAKVTRQNTSMRIETPSGVATVKGTIGKFKYLNDIFDVYCIEGSIILSNEYGTLVLGPQEMGRLLRGEAPQFLQGNPDDNFEPDADDVRDIIEIYFENEQGEKKKLILEF